MIIWSRWGIFVLLFVGVGAGIGFALAAAAGSDTGSGSPASMFIGLGLAISAVGLFFFSRYALDRGLDKPRPAYLTQRLAEPFVNANGIRQTHQQLPVLHPQTGEQIWTRPRSTFFFVPVRYWPYVLGGLGLVLFVSGLVGTLIR